MVTRACKNIFNKYLRECSNSDVAQLLTNLLNAFFSEQHQQVATRRVSASGSLNSSLSPNTSGHPRRPSGSTNTETRSPDSTEQNESNGGTQPQNPGFLSQKTVINSVRMWDSIRKRISDSYEYKLLKPTPPYIFSHSTLR